MSIDYPKWSELRNWIEYGIQPTQYNFAVWLNEYLHDTLPQHFLDYDWRRSFDLPLVIYYDERVSIETVETLHRYLRTQQACDIENILVLTSHCLGLDSWWQQRCRLYGEKSFQIKEWLFIRSMGWRKKFFPNLKLIDEQYIKEKKTSIRYLFDSYGGTNSKLDRLYIALKLRDLSDIGVVDLVTAFDVNERQLLSHAMYLGYFKNTHEEDFIVRLYKKYVKNDRLVLNEILTTIGERSKIKKEVFNTDGFQFNLDSICLSTVCNETDNMQPWTMVSEKTLRSFWHHTAVVPNSYLGVDLLESKGFWFPHDIIDYSYQNESDWLTRINLMIKSLQRSNDRLQGKYTEYFMDNFDKFRYNAELLQKHYDEDID